MSCFPVTPVPNIGLWTLSPRFLRGFHPPWAHDPFFTLVSGFSFQITWLPVVWAHDPFYPLVSGFPTRKFLWSRDRSRPIRSLHLWHMGGMYYLRQILNWACVMGSVKTKRARNIRTSVDLPWFLAPLTFTRDSRENENNPRSQNRKDGSTGFYKFV